MPPIRDQKAKKLVEQEGRIQLAIADINNHRIPSIREAARIYKVPVTTLHNRIKGSTFRAEHRANSHKLTQNEEESLLQWILSLDKRGASPRPSHIQEMAGILLSKRGYPDLPSIGKNWALNFIKRRDELKTRCFRRYNYQRAKCEDPKIIQEWFNLVQITIMQHGIASEDIYNFDETGFAMGLVATAKAVTRSEMIGKPDVIQPGNREWVTSIECISSAGWVLPPCIIFKGKVHIESWYQNEAIPGDWRIEVSANGWTTDEIGLRWLQTIFIPATASRTTGRYRLLVLDGHGSHLTPQFDQICSENDIIPICMPPHSSHLLQPLDVGCFSPLKRAYGRLVENKMRLGFNHIDKDDFLEAYPQARTAIFTADNIYSGFRATGLIPFQPNRVISQLNVQLKTPTPPPSRQTNNSDPKTPHNLKQLRKTETTIKKRLSEHIQIPSTPTRGALGHIFKACELAMNEVIILRKENQDLRASHEKMLVKKKRSKRQIEAPTGLSIQEGQEAFQNRNQAANTTTTEPTTEPTEAVASTDQPPKRAPPRCSNCHIVGHKRTQCPNPISN